MKLCQKKTNTNSIKTMSSTSNTPIVKSKYIESTIKSILKEVEDKIGNDTDNNYKNFKQKEKITSKIIEKYKKQIREKEQKDKVGNKILTTSYKENLDVNTNQIIKNKSSDSNVMVTELQKINVFNISEIKPFKSEEPYIFVKQTESHRDVAKILNFANLNTNINHIIRESSSVDKRNLIFENKTKTTIMEEFIKMKNMSKEKKEAEIKIKNYCYQKDLLRKEKDKSNPNIVCDVKEMVLMTQNIGHTPKNIKGVMNSKKAAVSNNRNIQISNILNKLSKKKNEIEEDDEYFEYEDDKKIDLSSEERALYGNREPKGYSKIKLIGKGGCGIVWLCKSCKNEIVAIKQISKKNLKSDVSHFARKEIEIFNYLSHIQQNDNIIKLLDYVEDSNDFWLVFEKGGQNFGSLLFKLKGDFHNNERIYCIQKGIFLKYLFTNLKLFKDFLRKMLNFINFLTLNGITHCDIKPDNILIDYKVDDVNEATITNLKMIDFGSAFYFKTPDNFNSNTPEYMSPEINEINEKGGNSLSIVQFIRELNPWCIDMWSLGVTVLEIVLACPTWMSYKTKIIRNNKVIFTTGLFAVKGRNNMKIFQKQIEAVKSLKTLLQDCLITDSEEREKFIDLMQRILDINWKSRISPIEALNHSFFD